MLVMVNNNHSDDLRKFEKQIITNSAVGDIHGALFIHLHVHACSHLLNNFLTLMTVDCIGGGPLSIRSRPLVLFGRFIWFGCVPAGAGDGVEELLSTGGKVQRSWKL